MTSPVEKKCDMEDSDSKEDQADVEDAVSKEEGVTVKGTRMLISHRLQMLKLKRSQQRGYAPSGLNISAIYDMKLRKLQRNNNSLAKALADQKMETQQWYNEVISLKGELQEAQERLLRLSNKNPDSAVEQEVERRIKEIGEPLNAAINQAMDNMLLVVENFSRVKQLANVRMNSWRSSSSSSISFGRSSGSRAPLSSGNNVSSPCQSVRPMVSGHVLQPAMVAIQKLDDVWKARVNERIQAREDLMDMTTIGEQSVDDDEQQDNSAADLDQSSNMLEESSENTTNIESPRSPERPRNRRTRSRSRGSPQSPSKSAMPRASVSPRVLENGQESKPESNKRRTPNKDSPGSKKPSSISTPLNLDEDPLEGPSWWYDDSTSGHGRGRRRGRGRGRGRGQIPRGGSVRGRKRGRPRSGQGSSCLDSPLNISNESEEDSHKSKRSRTSLRHQPEKEVDSKENESPKQEFDKSYLASPQTMLTKLEGLEERSGRRSKSRSKGRGLRPSFAESIQKKDLISESEGENMDSSSMNDNASVGQLLSQAVDNGAEASTNDSGEGCLDNRCEDDFYIKDSDLTCIGDISMDITEPISKILSYASADHKKKETMNNGRKIIGDKKFFKGQTNTQAQKKDEKIKTPFDLSLLDATYIPIASYSSENNIEKENMPPKCVDEIQISGDEEGEAVNLKRVSVILQDVMKTSKSGSVSPEKCEALPSDKTDEICDKEKDALESTLVTFAGRKKKAFKVSQDIEGVVDDSDEEDDSWSPGKLTNKKPVKVQRKRKSNAKRKNSVDNDSKLRRSRLSKRISKNIPENSPRKQSLWEDENSLEENKNKSIQNPPISPVAASSTLNGTENVTSNMNECYVKICRTPLKEVCKSTSEIQSIDDASKDFQALFDKVDVMEDITSEVFKSLQNDSTDSIGMDRKDSASFSEPLDISSDTSLAHPKEAAFDQVVPHEDEISDTENHAATGKSKMNSVKSGNVSNDSHTMAEVDDVDNMPLMITQSPKSFKEENPPVEVEAPRRRRGAAMKLNSFKEPNLRAKMRQEKLSVDSCKKTKNDRKSGRKSNIS